MSVIEDAPEPEIETQALFDELYTAFASTRGGNHPEKMARALLRLDESRDVVALTTDARQAVLFDPAGHTLSLYDVGPHGLASEPAEMLWSRCSDPAAWVDAHPDRVSWVNPRYRWVLDLDSEHSTWTFAIVRPTDERGRDPSSTDTVSATWYPV